MDVIHNYVHSPETQMTNAWHVEMTILFSYYTITTLLFTVYFLASYDHKV